MTQLIQQISGRAIKTDIDDGFMLNLRGLDEVEIENGGQTAGVVVPDHIVADEQPAQKEVQAIDARGHAAFVHSHGLISFLKKSPTFILRQLAENIKDIASHHLFHG